LCLLAYKCLFQCICLLICPPVPTRLPLDGISVKFDIVDFHKNLSRIFQCCSSRTKLSGDSHENLNVCIIVSGTCSASVYKTHCFSCMATRYMLIALLTTTYIREKIQRESLLRFRGNSGYANAPQCRYTHFAYLAYLVSTTEFILSEVAT